MINTRLVLRPTTEKIASLVTAIRGTETNAFFFDSVAYKGKEVFFSSGHPSIKINVTLQVLRSGWVIVDLPVPYNSAENRSPRHTALIEFFTWFGTVYVDSDEGLDIETDYNWMIGDHEYEIHPQSYHLHLGAEAA